MIGVYTIRNKINNKIYVGLSVNLKYRLFSHRNQLIKECHENPYLQNEVRKYKLGNFEIEVLEECEEQFLYSVENYWCNMLNVHNRNFGYNIRPTNPYGMSRLSEETKLRQSIAAKGKVKTKEHLLNISLTNKGKIITISQREKIGNALRGRKRPQELVDRINLIRKNNGQSDKQLEAKSEKVLNKETKEIYSSLLEACKILNLNYYNTRARLSGKVYNDTIITYLKYKDIIPIKINTVYKSAKAVNVFDLFGKFLYEFETIRGCEREMVKMGFNVTSSGVVNSCKGKYSNHCNMIFKYSK